MPIEGYVSKLRDLLWELQETLSSDEIKILKRELDGFSDGQWLRFLAEDYKLIREFQVASPSKRNRLKKFQDPNLKGKLVLAAYQCLKGGYLFLRGASEAYQYEGLPYREAGVIASRDAYDLFAAYPYIGWPFDHDPPKGFRVDDEFLY